MEETFWAVFSKIKFHQESHAQQAVVNFVNHFLVIQKTLHLDLHKFGTFQTCIGVRLRINKAQFMFSTGTFQEVLTDVKSAAQDHSVTHLKALTIGKYESRGQSSSSALTIGLTT